MRNRSGVEYNFVKVGESRYHFEMDKKGMEYMRLGGREGQDVLDMSDLGFFDPPGGPFIAIGSAVDNRTVKHIEWDEAGIFVEVSDE